jgi:hypothetical protein
VVTEIKKYKNIDKLVNDFASKIEAIKSNIAPMERPFNSVYVTISDKNVFYLWTSKLISQKKAKGLPYFDFFEGTTKTTELMQKVAHEHPKWGHIFVDTFITGIHGKKTYRNHPLSWIFIQQSWIDYSMKYERNHDDHLVWAQQSYIFPHEFLGPVLKLAKTLQQEYRPNDKLICKMEDVVPLMPAKFLMAPAFMAESNLYIYTFTWPIKNQEQKEAAEHFSDSFLRACNDSADIGPNVVHVHMLKEFDTGSSLLYETYQRQIDTLNNILDNQGIDDSFLWNKMFQDLYHISRERHP